MVIQTQRLRLVPLSLRYLDSACAYALNPDNARMMVYLPNRDKAETSFSNSPSCAATSISAA